jgi:hypothetical protein
VAPILTIAGGAVVVLGSLLPWFELRANPERFGGAGGAISRSVGGLQTSQGTLLLVIGVVLVVFGAVMFAVPGRSARFTIALLAALGALFAAAVALYNALTPTSQAIDAISSELGPAGIAARRFVEGLFDRGFISIDAAIGLWLVVLGALVALVGSVLSFLGARSGEPQPIAAWAGSSSQMPATAAPESPAGPVSEGREPPAGP